MDQTATRYDVTFKSWTVKEITVEKTNFDGELYYDVKQEWLFKDEMTGIVADIIITVATDPKIMEGTKIARLRLSADLGVKGLTPDVPKELFGQIGIILLHTARGVLLQAGAGTILAHKGVPMYTLEEIAGQA
jgi:hypothetical protein